jgi:hypothetical protein
MIIPFLICAFTIAVVATVVGFGTSTMLIPLAVLFFDIKKAIVMVAFFHFFANISRISLFKDHINWRLIPIYGIPLLVSCFLGAWLLQYLPSDTLRFAFGIFLVLYALVSFCGSRLTMRPGNVTAICGGLASGVLSGLLGMGGAVRVAFLQVFGLQRDSFIATNAGLALMADMIRIPVYLATGVMNPHREDFLLIPLMVIVAYLGTLLGRRLAKSIPEDRFRHVVLAALLLAGLNFIFRG